MSSTEEHSADDDLVQTLNLLLDSLDIPIELESVLDLTPTLLLAILESTLSSRLPLSSKLRAADSLKAQAKVEAVKIFLGVLGNDLLEMDLSDIDPRRLARGELEEVEYVSRLLILVAKQAGMLGADETEIVEPNRTPQTRPKLSPDDSLVSNISSLQLNPAADKTNSFSVPLPPSHPLAQNERPSSRENRLQPKSNTPSRMISSHTGSILSVDSSFVSTSQPERASTPSLLRQLDPAPKPPSGVKSPVQMISGQSSFREHRGSDTTGLDLPSFETTTSICTCDITGATSHCNCSHMESSYSYSQQGERTYQAGEFLLPAQPVSPLSWRNPPSGSRTIRRQHARRYS